MSPQYCHLIWPSELALMEDVSGEWGSHFSQGSNPGKVCLLIRRVSGLRTKGPPNGRASWDHESLRGQGLLFRTISQANSSSSRAVTECELCAGHRAELPASSNLHQ